MCKGGEKLQKVINYPDLRAEMARIGDTRGDLAKLLGIHQSVLCKKFDGTTFFTDEQIEKMCNHYNKTKKQLGFGDDYKRKVKRRIYYENM